MARWKFARLIVYDDELAFAAMFCLLVVQIELDAIPSRKSGLRRGADSRRQGCWQQRLEIFEREDISPCRVNDHSHSGKIIDKAGKRLCPGENLWRGAIFSHERLLALVGGMEDSIKIKKNYWHGLLVSGVVEMLVNSAGSAGPKAYGRHLFDYTFFDCDRAACCKCAP